MANDAETRAFRFLLTRKLRSKLSDDHLWFSIFSYSKSNRLTRLQRCTTAFVLLFLSMLFNILYYDLSNPSSSVQLTLGPLTFSLQQVIIGVMIEFFVLVPSLLLLQSFRLIQSRVKSPRWSMICLFAVCFSLIGMSIVLIIARGIGFGDAKCQQWLISIVTGFFSSIFITQPLKVCF